MPIRHEAVNRLLELGLWICVCVCVCVCVCIRFSLRVCVCLSFPSLPLLSTWALAHSSLRVTAFLVCLLVYQRLLE